MRSPRAVCPTAKLLIFLAFSGVSAILSGEAGGGGPSGQILRVSLHVCVPKSENRSFMSKHVAKKPQAAKESGAASPAPEPAEGAAASASERDVTPPVRVANREGPPAADLRQKAAPAEHDSAPLAAFGSLFVGAFHSTMTMGAAAFK